MKLRHAWFAISLALATIVVGSGCTFKGGAPALQPRAAFDLQCPEGQIQLTELSGCGGIKMANTRCTMGASGCGRQATYIDVNGNWIMNNSASNQGTQAH